MLAPVVVGFVLTWRHMSARKFLCQEVFLFLFVLPSFPLLLVALCPNSTALMLQAVLLYFLNGDWAIERIRVFCPSERGCPDEYREALLEQVVDALVPKLIPVFPRHRWTGSQASIDWFGPLVVMGAFQECIPVWAKCV